MSRKKRSKRKRPGSEERLRRRLQSQKDLGCTWHPDGDGGVVRITPRRKGNRVD